VRFITLCCIFLHLGAAEDDQLLPPIKPGRDAGLVIVPGAYLAPEQYYAVARNIQEASEFALWVYVQDDPTATLIPRRDFVVTAKEALHLAGMPEDAPYVSIGHSMGGAFSIFEIEENPSLVDGVVTWGADGFITSENVYILGVPSMTVAGDLDGMTRVTMLAKQFRDLSVLPQDVRLRCPVRTLTGLNHTSYNTGPVPLVPQLRDLPSEIEGEEAREIIARDNAFFIDFCARLKLGEDTSADLEKLQDWFDFQSEFYAPLLAAMDMELSPDGQECPWTIEAQRVIGRAFEEELMMENHVTDKDGLVASRSLVERIDENTVFVNTTTSVPPQFGWAAAKMIESKMSSMEKFDQVLNREPSQDPKPTCKDANIALWNKIYPTISQTARRRFEARQFNINFKEDDVQWWGPGWIDSEMEFSSDGNTLNVTSTSIKTGVAIGGAIGGAHYCKLMSPFRLIEFLYIDSLRVNGF